MNENKKLKQSLLDAEKEIKDLKELFVKEKIEAKINFEVRDKVEQFLQAIFKHLGFDEIPWQITIRQTKDQNGYEPDWWKRSPEKIKEVSVYVTLEKEFKKILLMIGCDIEKF